MKTELRRIVAALSIMAIPIILEFILLSYAVYTWRSDNSEALQTARRAEATATALIQRENVRMETVRQQAIERRKSGKLPPIYFGERSEK